MRILKGLMIIPVLALLLTSCGKEEKKKDLPEGMREVKVLEKIDASSYSYFKVEEDGKDFWIAVNKNDAQPGDKLYFTGGLEMKNYFSQSLNKNFDSVLFVDHAMTELPETHDVKFKHPEIKSEEVISQKISPAEGSKTVAEIYEGKSSLNSKAVKVRGKVVKVNSGIMGKNWIHIQDGTQAGYDLLITTLDEAKVGDIILAEGFVSENKDFGSGYSYEVLIEDAKILKNN